MFRGFRLLEGDSMGPCAPPTALPIARLQPPPPPLPASAASCRLCTVSPHRMQIPDAADSRPRTSLAATLGCQRSSTTQRYMLPAVQWQPLGSQVQPASSPRVHGLTVSSPAVAMQPSLQGGIPPSPRVVAHLHRITQIIASHRITTPPCATSAQRSSAKEVCIHSSVGSLLICRVPTPEISPRILRIVL